MKLTFHLAVALLITDAFVIGEGGLVTALHERKPVNDAIEPRCVIVGEGSTTMDRVPEALECLEHGACLPATNPENSCPISSAKTYPGAVAAILEASTGRCTYYLGKPSDLRGDRAAASNGFRSSNAGPRSQTELHRPIPRGSFLESFPAPKCSLHLRSSNLATTE